MKPRDESTVQIATALMAAGNTQELLQRLAVLVREQLEADWAGVWIYEPRKKRYTLDLSLPEGQVTPLAKRAGRKGDLLHEAVLRKGPVVRRGEEIAEPLLQHLETARLPPVREIFCIPFTLESDRIGLLELIRETLTPQEERASQARFLAAVAALASSSAAALVRVETGRETQMAAINRLMQLYDVSQVFHSTLERDELLPVISNRIALMLAAPFCRIWLPAGEDGEGLVCAFPVPDAGDGDSEAEAGAAPDGGAEPPAGRTAEFADGVKAAEEAAAASSEPTPERDPVPMTVFKSGEALLIADVAGHEASDRLEQEYGAGQAGSVMAAPLLVDETCLGAIEVIRAPGEQPFGEEDRDFLEELARQAAVAIRNSNLLMAERKAHELDALLDISREITSTLDLDRVLATIVNRADDIVPSERCSLLLADGPRLELRAVSGRLELDRKDPQIRDLEEILSWAHLSGQGIYISEVDGEIEADREETREKFRRYFERSGMKTLVSHPLKDGEGPLGVIAIESSQPYFVPEDKLEAFDILANQATVAIRNASLYRQIPLIRVMGPLAGLRSRLGKVSRRKWLLNAGIAAAVGAALVLIPWNMKIPGRVVVLPARTSAVTTEVEGVVDAIHFREGEQVRRGDLLATLVDRESRMRAEEAKSLYEIADREVAASDSALDLAAARQARIRRDQMRERYAILRLELEKTRIVAPTDGIVLTPRLERRAGTFLEKGEVFCRIADMSDVMVEVLVGEADVAEVLEGQRIRLKIDAFPTETFFARVEMVSQKAVEEADGRFFVARGRLEGRDLPLRNGMVGRAKVEIGPRSIAYVLLRRPTRFLWRTIWAWLP